MAFNRTVYEELGVLLVLRRRVSLIIIIMEPSSPAQQNGHASGDTEAKVNGTTEKEIHEQIQADVIVIGAGFSGITAMHRLRKHGLSVKCLEAGGGFGGVWYWNR